MKQSINNPVIKFMPVKSEYSTATENIFNTLMNKTNIKVDSANKQDGDVTSNSNRQLGKAKNSVEETRMVENTRQTPTIIEGRKVSKMTATMHNWMVLKPCIKKPSYSRPVQAHEQVLIKF